MCTEDCSKYVPCQGKRLPCCQVFLLTHIIWKCRDVTILSQAIFPSLSLFFFVLLEDFQGVAALRLSVLFMHPTGCLSLPRCPFVGGFRCDFEHFITKAHDFYRSQWDISCDYVLLKCYKCDEKLLPLTHPPVFVVMKLEPYFIIFDSVSEINTSCRIRITLERSFHMVLW